jgi:hypothetical protein
MLLLPSAVKPVCTHKVALRSTARQCRSLFAYRRGQHLTVTPRWCYCCAAAAAAGVCEGLKANINSASQGETEPVIFKARWGVQGNALSGVAMWLHCCLLASRVPPSCAGNSSHGSLVGCQERLLLRTQQQQLLLPLQLLRQLA